MPAALDDFPDRFSPMLVKELRQGLRARTFIVVFLALQALLAIILLSASVAASYDEIGTVISRIIFIFFSIAVLVVQPLRGINSVFSEIKGRTIDLMVLSRLSALRIVFGKWVALVSQSALLLAAIIPYLVLRYFFGRMNLFGELSLLGAVFLFSMFLTAVTVGFSAVPSILVRAVLPLIGAPVLLFFIMAICMSPGFTDAIEFFTFTQPGSLSVAAIIAAAMLYLGWTALDFAAGLIAPPAENHSTVRRLAALAIAGTCVALAAVASHGSPASVSGHIVLRADWADWIIPILLICMTPAIAIALTEQSRLIPAVCRRFVRMGFFGRFLGRFLYPGWASGVWFVGLVGLLVAACALIMHGHDLNIDPLTISSWFGTLLFPALFIIPLRKKFQTFIAPYILILIGSLVFALILAILATVMGHGDSGFLWFFFWLPPLHPTLENLRGAVSMDSALSSLWSLVLYCVLFIFSIPSQRKISEIELETRQSK